MKFLIASDIHGSAYYCEQLLQAFEREQAARLLLLGDILYHGPRNDLPRDYAPKKVTAMLNGMADTILCVRGNCDTEVDQMVLTFRTDINSTRKHRRRCVRAMCCCTDIRIFRHGSRLAGKTCI